MHTWCTHFIIRLVSRFSQRFKYSYVVFILFFLYLVWFVYFYELPNRSVFRTLWKIQEKVFAKIVNDWKSLTMFTKISSYSPGNVKFDPAKILYWPIFGLGTRQGIYFQFLKSPHLSPFGKYFYRQLFLFMSRKIWNSHISATKNCMKKINPSMDSSDQGE